MANTKFLRYFLCLFMLYQGYIIGSTNTEKPLVLYKHNVYTSRDGLPHNSIFEIVQTTDGFIWLATDSGIARFDGVEFDVYNVENTPALSDDIIRDLLVDRKGILWIATLHGGIISYRQSRFKKMYSSKNGLSNDSVRVLFESADGSLWFGTDGGLNHMKEGILSVIPFPESAVSKSVRALAEDLTGQLWIGTTEGLLKLTRREDEYIVTKAGFPGDYITSLAADSKKNLWIGTNGKGLIRLQTEGNRQTSYTSENGLSSNLIDSLFIDRDGAILVATRGGGLNRMQEARVTVIGTAEGLSHNYVSSVFRDREGNLWVGTNGGGLNLYSDSKIIAYNTKNGLSFDQVYGIYQDSGENIWVGTFGAGINLIRNGRVIKNYTIEDGLPTNFVISICEDSSGHLWFGTFGGGAVRMKDGHFQIFDKKDGLINNFVYGIYTDRRGRLWTGTSQGGLHYLSGGRFKLFKRLEGKVRAFLEDSRGRLWVGTDTFGLLRIKDEETEIFDRSSGLSSLDILSIFEDKTGSIYAATFGGGINRYHEEKRRFDSLRRRNGLPHDIVFRILEDDAEHLWMSCMDGIFRISRKSLEDFFTGKATRVSGMLFDEADGMKVRECNGGSQPSGWRTKDGRLWFITAAGVAVVDPAITGMTSHPPTTGIKRVIIDGVVYDPKPNIDVSPGKKDIQINYTAPSFRAPERLQFKYKLEGYSEDWVNAGTRREAFYTNVSYGTYRFYVNSRNREGPWNLKGASFTLNITPHFWQTWWFKISVIFFLLFFIRLLYLLKVRSIKRQQRELENLVADRTRSLKTKTVELENKRAALEKINQIVKSINAAVDYNDILISILEETSSFVGTKNALALVYDKSIDAYTFKSALRYDVERLKPIRFSFEEAEARYIQGAEEISKDFFILKNIRGRPAEEKIKPFTIPRSMLVLKIRSENTAVGYLIFEDMEDENAFEKQELQLLDELKDHVAAAFIKSKLLLELAAERETAETANQSKSMFLARMSHEIRTPMNAVIGFAEMLKDTQLNEDQQEFTRNITKSGEVLLTLIDEILDFSKIEAGQLVLQSVEFNLKEVAYDVCRLIRPRIGDKPVEILCRIDNNVHPYLRGDAGRLRQVLINLMGNAAKFTHSGEIELLIDTETETENQVKIRASVRDTGIGIPEDHLESIFEQFQQADGSISRKYGGTGLGLAISKQIALLMNGDIRVESEVGKGSTFYLTAWLEKSYKKSMPEEERTMAAVNLSGREKWNNNGSIHPTHILLAEDNPVNRKLARFMLTKGGYLLDTVTNGKQAVETYTAEPGKYDLIFMDINMPEMDGIEAAKNLRKKGFVDIPIIAMTAHALKEDREICLKAGMNDYIPKPIKQEIVFNMIQKWAHQRQPKSETTD